MNKTLEIAKIRLTKANEGLIKNVVDILRCPRPNNSEAEYKFVQDKLIPTIEDLGFDWEQDGYGNIFVDNGGETLFTCHTDTVHGKDFGVVFEQELVIDKENFVGLKLDKGCLGADDGAGIFILLHLLKHNTRGNFAFFRDEEIGGVGSAYAVDNNPEYFKRFKRAIAFDRRGTSDVITHQGLRCSSDEFAFDLATRLGMNYQPCNGGVFTDTAQMTHLIPECTNISVGYYDEHKAVETLDLNHYDRLLTTLTTVEWDNIVVVRDVNDVEEYADWDLWGNYGTYDTQNGNCISDNAIKDAIKSIELGGDFAAEELVYSNPLLAAELLMGAYG